MAAQRESTRLRDLERLEALMRGQEGETGLVAGIDEVGRGSLAGPVVSCCVVMRPDAPGIPGVDDSKVLGRAKRARIYRLIREGMLACAFGYSGAARVDEVNVLNAARESMADALRSMPVRPDAVFVDSVRLPDCGLRVISFPKADSLVYSVAAASILAKVHRDAIMARFDREYPGYGFASNAGYGTPAHIRALEKLGPCAIHRATFISNLKH